MYKIELKKLKDGCEFGLLNTMTELNLELYSLLIKRKLSIWNAEILLGKENHELVNLFNYGLFKHSIKSFSIKQSGIIKKLYSNINSSFEEWEYLLKTVTLDDDITYRIKLCNTRLHHLLNEKKWSYSFNELGLFLGIDSRCLTALKESKILIEDFSLVQEKMIAELYKPFMVSCYDL